MSLGQALVLRAVLIWIAIGLFTTGLVFSADSFSRKTDLTVLDTRTWSRGWRLQLAARNALLGPIAFAQLAYGFWVGYTISQRGGSVHDALEALDTRPEGCLPEGRGCRDTSCDRCWETRPTFDEDEQDEDDEP